MDIMYYCYFLLNYINAIIKKGADSSFKCLTVQGEEGESPNKVFGIYNFFVAELAHCVAKISTCFRKYVVLLLLWDTTTI